MIEIWREFERKEKEGGRKGQREKERWKEERKEDKQKKKKKKQLLESSEDRPGEGRGNPRAAVPTAGQAWEPRAAFKSQLCVQGLPREELLSPLGALTSSASGRGQSGQDLSDADAGWVSWSQERKNLQLGIQRSHLFFAFKVLLQKYVNKLWL